MNESEMIDSLLNHYAVRSNPQPDLLTREEFNIYDNAIEKLLAYKLIEVKNKPGFYKITERGLEAYKAGGINRWLEENKRKSDELHNATIASSQATVDSAESAKKSKNYTFVATGVAAASLIILIYQTYTSNKQDKEIETLQNRISHIDTLLSESVNSKSLAPKPKILDKTNNTKPR